jgi:hypothetical protein
MLYNQRILKFVVLHFDHVNFFQKVIKEFIQVFKEIYMSSLIARFWK